LGIAVLIVIGRVTARLDTFDEILRVSREHVARSRKEPGCISHDVAVDPENPLRLLFTERWADEAALKAHFRVKESRIMWQTLQNLAADPGAMHIYRADEIKL
jgi:quinol monooxygenase YgiN